MTMVNAHLHTLEGWSDLSTRPGLLQPFDKQILNAPFLTADCGRSGGKGNCQCQRELICSRTCYEGFPLVSAYARLERQALIRTAYVNARIQSSYEGESIQIDPVYRQWPGGSAGKRNEGCDYDEDRRHCMAVDRYLMTMMPEEADGSLDNERYVQLPIGSMNGVTLVMQKSPSAGTPSGNCFACLLQKKGSCFVGQRDTQDPIKEGGATKIPC
ncbi:MAG: hypothetical protein ACRCYP_07440 [Alphaproteobacteria bacterium]